MTEKNAPISQPDDSDLFVQELDFSDLGDWEPKRLSLMGTIHLARWTARVGKAGFNIFEEYSASRDVTKTFESMLARLEKTETPKFLEDVIAEFFALILPNKSKKWVIDNWNNYQALEALTAWYLLEKAGEVFASGSTLLAVLTRRTRRTNAPASVPSDD